MNRNKLLTAIGLAAVFALVSCTQDEIADSNTLPKGMYPLEIASVTLAVESNEQPWTRVSESTDRNSSTFEWNGTEQIGVLFNGETITYTLNSGNTLTPDKVVYWQDTQTDTVTAWYPTATTVSLSDQSGGLAYVLNGKGTGNYQLPVTLNFTHSLAKVRVVLRGTQTSDVTKVEIKSYTTCTHTQGTVSTDDASEGWITMQKVSDTTWEANVVPGHEINTLKVNGATTTLANAVTPEAAKYHEINLVAGGTSG